MDDQIYTPLIDDFVWSYSRVNSFNGCRYAWFMKYICREKEDDMFYSSYGSFIHKLLEGFYKGELTKDEMETEFILDFQKEVKGKRPSAKIAHSYFQNGIAYFENFKPLPYKVLEVEGKFEFDLESKGKKYPFIGFIDYLGEDNEGNLILVDNKSRALKQRSKRKKPTVKDQELDEMLRQLYIYAEGVHQKYGKYPTKLCFNCFRNGEFIEEDFDPVKLHEAINWAAETIEQIRVANDFYPNIDYFKCRNICGLVNKCCYNE